MTQILEQAFALKDYCTNIRQMLHKHPEPSYEEFQTTARIRAELEKMGIACLPLQLKTGVVATIAGTGLGAPMVTALRADIDALKMEDLTQKPYASVVPGVAHCCGHDGHVAILLGAAKLLNENRDRFSGLVKLIFQPGEEGLEGSKLIIAAGAMKNPDVEAIVCLHGWPYFKVGEMGAWPGQYMASGDAFSVRMIGQSGHGARPYKAINPIVASATAISAIQNIVSSEIITAQQAVISVCKIHSGTAFNVIPDEVLFEGTVRCLDADVRNELEARIGRVVNGAAATYGCTVQYDYKRGVPPLVNHPALTDEVLQAGADALGAHSLKELEGPVMGSEDFSHYVEEIGKGVFFRLGVAPTTEATPIALHNSAFDFNDDAIPYGIAAMVQLIYNRHSIAL